jgi:hypothetical protein
VDMWQHATLGTLLDMKACYHNIPVDPDAKDLMGVVT